MLMAGCSSGQPETPAEQKSLDTTCQDALAKMKAKDSTLDKYLDHAYAYAIYPNVTTGAFLAGGAYGQGEVWQGDHLAGYTQISQGTVGAQVGLETYSELIVFQNEEALHRFEKGELTFAANASAVLLQYGATGQTPFKNGVAVFCSPTAGAIVSAAIGGQSFSYQPVWQNNNNADNGNNNNNNNANNGNNSNSGGY